MTGGEMVAAGIGAGFFLNCAFWFVWGEIRHALPARRRRGPNY